MRLPSITVGPGRCLILSRFTLSRLRCNTKAKTLAAPLELAHKTLKNAQLALNEASDAVLDARGPVAEVDASAQELTTGFQLDLLKVVNKDYSSVLYRKFLPKGLTDARKFKGADMSAFIGSLALVLDAEGKTSPLAAYGAKFADIQKGYLAPLVDLKKARDVEVLAGNTLDKARHDWVIAYDAIYGHLRALFAGRKGYVESFFMSIAPPKKAKGAPTTTEVEG